MGNATHAQVDPSHIALLMALFEEAPVLGEIFGADGALDFLGMAEGGELVRPKLEARFDKVADMFGEPECVFTDEVAEGRVVEVLRPAIKHQGKVLLRGRCTVSKGPPCGAAKLIETCRCNPRLSPGMNRRLEAALETLQRLDKQDMDRGPQGAHDALNAGYVLIELDNRLLEEAAADRDMRGEWGAIHKHICRLLGDMDPDLTCLIKPHVDPWNPGSQVLEAFRSSSDKDAFELWEGGPEDKAGLADSEAPERDASGVAIQVLHVGFRNRDEIIWPCRLRALLLTRPRIVQLLHDMRTPAAARLERSIVAGLLGRPLPSDFADHVLAAFRPAIDAQEPSLPPNEWRDMWADIARRLGLSLVDPPGAALDLSLPRSFEDYELSTDRGEVGYDLGPARTIVKRLVPCLQGPTARAAKGAVTVKPGPLEKALALLPERQAEWLRPYVGDYSRWRLSSPADAPDGLVDGLCGVVEKLEEEVDRLGGPEASPEAQATSVVREAVKLLSANVLEGELGLLRRPEAEAAASAEEQVQNGEVRRVLIRPSSRVGVAASVVWAPLFDTQGRARKTGEVLVSVHHGHLLQSLSPLVALPELDGDAVKAALRCLQRLLADMRLHQPTGAFPPPDTLDVPRQGTKAVQEVLGAASANQIEFMAIVDTVCRRHKATRSGLLYDVLRYTEDLLVRRLSADPAPSPETRQAMLTCLSKLPGFVTEVFTGLEVFAPPTVNVVSEECDELYDLEVDAGATPAVLSDCAADRVEHEVSYVARLGCAAGSGPRREVVRGKLMLRPTQCRLQWADALSKHLDAAQADVAQLGFADQFKGIDTAAWKERVAALDKCCADVPVERRTQAKVERWLGRLAAAAWDVAAPLHEFVHEYVGLFPFSGANSRLVKHYAGLGNVFTGLGLESVAVDSDAAARLHVFVDKQDDARVGWPRLQGYALGPQKALEPLLAKQTPAPEFLRTLADIRRSSSKDGSRPEIVHVATGLLGTLEVMAGKAEMARALDKKLAITIEEWRDIAALLKEFLELLSQVGQNNPNVPMLRNTFCDSLRSYTHTWAYAECFAFEARCLGDVLSVKYGSRLPPDLILLKAALVRPRVENTRLAFDGEAERRDDPMGTVVAAPKIPFAIVSRKWGEDRTRRGQLVISRGPVPSLQQIVDNATREDRECPSLFKWVSSRLGRFYDDPAKVDDYELRVRYTRKHFVELIALLWTMHTCQTDQEQRVGFVSPFNIDVQPLPDDEFAFSCRPMFDLSLTDTTLRATKLSPSLELACHFLPADTYDRIADGSRVDLSELDLKYSASATAVSFLCGGDFYDVPPKMRWKQARMTLPTFAKRLKVHYPPAEVVELLQQALRQPHKMTFDEWLDRISRDMEKGD